MAKPGRKPLPDAVRRSREIRFRMTEDERARAIEAATRLGLDLSEYLRRQALPGPEPAKTLVDVP